MKSKLITSISYWLVSVTMGVLIVLFVYQCAEVAKFFEPVTPLEITPEDNTRVKNTSLGFYGYELKQQSVYTSYSDVPFKQVLSIKVPSTKIRPIMTNEKSTIDVHNLNKTKIEASVDLAPTPVVYHVYNKQDRHLVIIGYALVSSVFMALHFYWLLVLRKFIKSLAANNFFEKINAKRMVILSIPAFLLPLISYVVELISESYFTNNFQISNGMLTTHVFHFNPLPIVFGLIFLMMAGIIYEGSKMKQEQGLTI